MYISKIKKKLFLKICRIIFRVHEADAARSKNYWEDAIYIYSRYVVRFPNDLGVKVRLANTYRESGNYPSAISILREVIKTRPEKAELCFLLADILSESGQQENINDIVQSIFSKGGGRAVPKSVSSPVTPPKPPHITRGNVTVLINNSADGTGLEKTLESLRGCEGSCWSAVVFGAQQQGNEKSQLSSTDPRVIFQESHSLPVSTSGPVMIIEAGTIIRPRCIPWLIWALDDGVDAVYCDFEVEDNDDDRLAVALQSGPNALEIRNSPIKPALVLFRSLDGIGIGIGDARSVQGALLTLLHRGVVRHIPLLLAVVARGGKSGIVVDADMPQQGLSGRILVVIPTRDKGEHLNTMISSLLNRASSVSELDIVVVDNGSRDTVTIDIMNKWRSRGVEIIRRDEPFNWSRLNNAACNSRVQPIVVFANNDMEMLTEEWDLKLRHLLVTEAIGVVGARLLYPNDRVQHAGIVMGALNGEPLHEGLRVSSDERGPLDRWVRCRPATAVTGAFMAMRRSVFDRVCGFDEDFAVSCNDVDFCLRVGAAGLTVLYAPELTLRHHESLSRGHANTEAKQNRAAEEMARLLTRWGYRASFDPTRNPQWEGRGIRLFAGIRSLTAEEVMDWAINTESRPFVQAETPTLA
jgi:GT2 family glycosyltransferase